VVHCQRQAPAACGQLGRQPRHAQQLGAGHDLVADVDVGHAAGGQGFGLGHLLHAHALGTGLLHQQGQLGALVHLGMGAPAHPVLAREFGHALDVAFHGIEVQHQRGCVDQVHPCADAGAQGFR